MARPPIPDPEKRLNVGLRLHPGTLQRLDEIVTFFQGLRRLNPMLPFGYPESRTDVIEFLLREGIREVMDHALAWNRIGTARQKPGDLDLMGQSAFWNTLVAEVRLHQDVVPESWRDLEWPPIPKRAAESASTKPAPRFRANPAKSKGPQKPNRS